VHGPDFYASKKHKGNNDHNGSGNDESKGHDSRNKPGDSEASPRSDDFGTKTASVSSPSMKSEVTYYSLTNEKIMHTILKYTAIL